MAVSGAVQALIAAFFFGIVVNTASAGVVLYIKGHGSTIFRDGLRLALILFLTSSALWAQVEFLATVIDATATSTCQVAVIFSTLLDQFARVSIEQFLIWSVAKDGAKSVAGMIPQILLLARFVVGMVLVGVSKPQFTPTCVPLSNVTPVAIAVIALDAVILASLTISALKSGSSKDGGRSSQDKTLLLIIAGLGIWMGTSVTLLLGVGTIDLFFRTTLPAIGLFILAALVTISSENLTVTRTRRPRQPESPTPQNISRDRDLASADSDEYPPSRYEDIKGMNAPTVMAYRGQDTPRNDANGLPMISRPITGVTGIGGVAVQGQLFPPIRANTIEQSSVSQVKTQVNLPKRSKTTGPTGKLVISHPIPIDHPDAQNAFNKIPTIDLATAARNEQERRAGHANRVSALIAKRPAPQPPSMSSEESLRRATSTKRKEAKPQSPKEIVRSNSTKTAQTGTNLSVEGNASSSSAQLSPSHEELRRRSPRQVIPTTVPAKTPNKASGFQPVTPGQPIRIPIPRPQPTPEPAPKVPEPVKTPLQRRPTNGLPSNPRAQAMRKLAEEEKGERQQTVMFINNIVYDDPSAVDTIIQGASKTPMSPLRSSNSVVNRPRPIPRKGDKDRQVFPAEVSPTHAHRRTKSGGSIMSRRSILQSTPGSPTQLPPLPPPPQSAGNVPRPQPNDTKSMTFDEKMSMFYAQPLSASSTTSTTRSVKRKSTVPDLPPVPPNFLELGDLAMIDPAPVVEDGRRLTKTTATSRSSVRTQSILGVEDLDDKYLQDPNRNVADELGNSWLPGISTGKHTPMELRVEGSKRQSSPVIPAIRYSEMSGLSETRSETRTRDEEITTVWGSVHSPVAAVDMQGARLNARSTYITKEARLPSVLSGVGEEVMTVMLDTSSEHSTTYRQSFLLDDDASLPDLPEPSEMERRTSGQWHRRVGEDCPTFSTRKEKVRSRKMPPPTPLLLKNSSSKKALVIQETEPSPLESPNAAYNMIQAQLRKLDESRGDSRDSVGSETRRIELLENLELEMGMQESKWQTMQHNLDRDSISTMQTDSRPVSVVNSVTNPISRSSSTKSILAERRASRRARMASGVRPREDSETATPSSQSSESSRASLWQTRLAEAQTQYMENAPDLITKRNNLNFLAVSKAALGSPTPPDTDESDEETETRFQSLGATVSNIAKEVHHLWRPSAPKMDIRNGALWIKPLQEPVSVNRFQLPGPSTRPVQRRSTEPLRINSTELWQKARLPTESLASRGLWGDSAMPQSQVETEKTQKALTRPLTQRPPRRNKRVTLLPDILESPQPLPDKRGTLGIFQFPWGEKSESATVQSIQPRPSQMFMAMPGTMTSGGPRINLALEARARQLEADEYSSSFFDDYDEEDGDNFDDFDDSDGDDFDETTLWEIASLLKTENIPSTNSLLPSAISSSVIEDYITEEESDQEIEEEYAAGPEMVLDEPVPVSPSVPAISDFNTPKPSMWTPIVAENTLHHNFGLQQPAQNVWDSYIPSDTDMVRSQPRIEELRPLESSQLWTSTPVNAVSKPALWVYKAAVKQDRHLGLPQPDLGIWEMYIPAASNAVRPQARVEDPTSLESNALWVQSVKTSQPSDALLWAAPRQTATIVAPKSQPILQSGSFMWKKPLAILESENQGLFDSMVTRPDYRRTSKAPAAISMTVKTRRNKEPMEALSTRVLWKASPKLAIRTTGKRQTMWSPTAARVANTTGLFQVDINRKTYRTTLAEPAALLMITKPRKSDAPLPLLQSSQFWSATSDKRVEVNWLKLSSSQPARPQPAAALQTSSLAGLFRVDPTRKVYRTTTADPAALYMETKPRRTDAPLSALESTQLWVLGRSTAAEFDWITISSVRPQSPSVASVTSSSSSTPSSPVSDSSSVKSTSTKASTIAPSTTGGFSLRGWFRRKKKAEPETPAMPQVPEIPVEFVVKNLDEVVHEKPVHVPLRHQHRSTVAFRCDWDDALREAVEASYPGTHFALAHATEAQWDAALQEAIKASHIAPNIIRRTATPKEWSTALCQAIAASYPQNRFSRGQVLPCQWEDELREAIACSQRVNFDASKIHPVFATSSLATESTDVHPAAIGYTYDVAVTHPVFFGSMKATSANVHPAMSGLIQEARPVARQQPFVSQPLLWSKTASQAATKPTAMWTAPTAPVAQLQAPILAAIETQVARHAAQSTSSEISLDVNFGKQGMWKRGGGMKRSDSRTIKRDWLDDSTKKRFSRIELRY
ncbi:hypothetical protein JX265_000978 [Neoarthrinium moseri]|uniref:Uncharacterized protein n=1 Tax=Neoarthrinium moseri TaxID=1658444 RepID=A0A9P9WWU0_9PEZI|nr:hypothetical protein JX265_000978 [Neoarthrinium moseri]